MRIALLALLLAPLTALADSPGFGDTFNVSIGGLTNTADFQVSSTANDRPLRELDLDDLGMDDEAQVAWVTADWRFLERWSLGLNFSSFDAEGRTEASFDGNFGPVDWQAGSVLKSSFDMDLYVVDLTWDFYRSDRAHLGAGLGLHIADLDMTVNASANTLVGNRPGVIDLGTGSASVTAPLPNLQLAGGLLLTDSLYLSASAGYFSFDYQQYEGDLSAVAAAIEWRAWRHVGVGLAYQYIALDLTISGSRRDEVFDTKFYGPVVFISAGF